MRQAVLQVSDTVRDTLRALDIRAVVDMRDGMKPGAKYYEWEGRGVPVRLEIGPRDVSAGQAMLARRTGGKSPVALDGIAESISTALDIVQRGLLDAARARRDEATHRVAGRDELVDVMQGTGGFAVAGFCGSEACEAEIKAQTKATIRVLPDEDFLWAAHPDRCVWCGAAAASEAIWAKAY